MVGWGDPETSFYAAIGSGCTSHDALSSSTWLLFILICATVALLLFVVSLCPSLLSSLLLHPPPSHTKCSPTLTAGGLVLLKRSSFSPLSPSTPYRWLCDCCSSLSNNDVTYNKKRLLDDCCFEQTLYKDINNL